MKRCERVDVGFALRLGGGVKAEILRASSSDALRMTTF
jgi:hypothetical protein